MSSRERPYQCKECGKTFRNRTHLKLHWVVHTGVRAYPCPECGKTFKRKYNLDEHKFLHTGEKPHKCQVCDRKFAFTSNLKKHMAIHLKLNHHCLLCNKSFKTLNDLKLHALEHFTKQKQDCTDNLCDQCPEGSAANPSDEQCNQSVESECTTSLPQHPDEPNNQLSDSEITIEISDYLETNIN